jgi:chromosome segregation ATPase
MSDKPVDTSNKAWNDLETDAKAGNISALEAMQRSHDRTEAVYRGYFTPMMEYFRQKEEKEEARDKNQQIVIEFLQRQETATSELRDMFQSLFEIVNGHTLDINDLKQTVAEHDREIASFRQSRDASIAERRQLGIDLAASKDDRAKIHEELRLAADERKAITEALARIEARLPAGDD